MKLAIKKVLKIGLFVLLFTISNTLLANKILLEYFRDGVLYDVECKEEGHGCLEEVVIRADTDKKVG